MTSYRVSRQQMKQLKRQHASKQHYIRMDSTYRNSGATATMKPKLDSPINRKQQRKILSIEAPTIGPWGMIKKFAIQMLGFLRAVKKTRQKWDQVIPTDFHEDLQNWISEVNSLSEYTKNMALLTKPIPRQQNQVW